MAGRSNSAEELTIYVVKERVTGLYGKVAGGKVNQFFVPDSILKSEKVFPWLHGEKLLDVFEKVDTKLLK